MYLGIDENSGLVYEGVGQPELVVMPTPNITQATLQEAHNNFPKLPKDLLGNPLSWVFREDSFDAVTRTRRGRIYKPFGTSQPSDYRVIPNNYEDPQDRVKSLGGRVTKSLHAYIACTELLQKSNRGEGATIILGAANAFSLWRIVQTEVLTNRCVFVTLKAMAAFGILPEVDYSKIKPDSKIYIEQAISRVLDSAFRETPISVIDQCRNAITVVLSRWLFETDNDANVLKLDLAEVAKKLDKQKSCVANLARTVALLHSRGKSNVQHTHNARIPIEEDAELAVQALGFTLRELGWVVY